MCGWGPPRAIQGKVGVVIGATPWVDNYNVPIFSNDMTAVCKIAKRVSSRWGGLHSVQSMAIAHGEAIIEVACNLLEPSRVGGSQVQVQIEQLAKEEGLQVGRGYYTDFSKEKIVETY
ncbi:uncharacterized protein LOC111408547 [Olea europaea var. sylvestris]|uniref:uncharacterized protein LOC111408547 n=1 Tax=Olea europaea var. sylvestris TaxID=158386 RepID=UPI000C1D1659|nr:uncharacterized protein LOC111408547 [Olea europaea var. sylvestris]